MKFFIFLILFSPVFCLAEEEKSSITIEEFLEGLSTVKGITQRRDPFEPVRPPFAPVTKVQENFYIPPLERFQVESYTVVATLVGGRNRIPRALIKVPTSRGLVIETVEVTDRIGNRGGRVVEVNENGIVVVQNQRTPLGFVDRARITLSLASGAKKIEPNSGKESEKNQVDGRANSDVE